MSRAFALWLFVMLVLPFGGPAPALAHGAGWQIDSSAKTILYRFGYTDGSAMAFAEVVVTSPDGKTWQKARTDRTGHFAFGLPPQSADQIDQEWQIKVADGMGHIVQLSYVPTAKDDAPPHTQTGLSGTADLIDLPLWLEILFGFSFLANLFGGLFLWRKRASQNATPAPSA